MSAIYDNWERLVAAVLLREQFRQLCHDDSSDFSSSCSTPPLVEEQYTSGVQITQSAIYNNWERLEAAVQRREEFRQLCRDDSSDFSSCCSTPLPVEKQHKSGVHITLVTLPGGARFVKRVRFSWMGFEERQLLAWPFNRLKSCVLNLLSNPNRSISAKQIPAQYGGISEGDFGTFHDIVSEVVVKPWAGHVEEFPITQACLLSWEVGVVGWEVNYSASFVPRAKDRYGISLYTFKKIRKEELISGSFKVDEPGKLVVAITSVTP